MPVPGHGSRRRYQIGCSCDPCTTANTAYERSYRQAVRVGRRPLGAHVAGTAVARAIALLVQDGYTKGAIATALGHQTPRLQYRGRVTLRTVYRLRRLLRHSTSAALDPLIAQLTRMTDDRPDAGRPADAARYNIAARQWRWR